MTDITDNNLESNKLNNDKNSINLNKADYEKKYQKI